MKVTGNTILITGGGRGIGRGLAEAFHTEGNQIIITGRNEKALAETVSANPGMKFVVLDVTDAGAIVRFAEQMRRDYPALNAVILNAGIMRTEPVQRCGVTDAEEIIATNLLGPIRLTAVLLPQLLAQPRAAIMTVSSGLAFVPLAVTPTYCAAKAAIHSYTQSLRFQLQHTPVEVLELVPPYVQTELLGPGGLTDPNAMPLNDFISESMQILKTSPETKEICVERVKRLRYAEASGNYDAFVRTFNERAASSHTTL